MTLDTTDDGEARPAPLPSDARSLRGLRHRIALLLLTFSVVVLPNLLSHAASLIGD